MPAIPELPVDLAAKQATVGYIDEAYLTRELDDDLSQLASGGQLAHRVSSRQEGLCGRDAAG